MTYRNHTRREMERAATELTHLLAAAHQRLNELGYPPVTIRPDEETTCGTWIENNHQPHATAQTPQSPNPAKGTAHAMGQT